jgi:hypothetical protein
MIESQFSSWLPAAATRSFNSPLPQGRSKDKDERVLYHELGHLIAGRELGQSVETISAEPHEMDGRIINGRVRWKQSSSDDDSNGDFECRFNRCIVLVAGAVAEQLFLGEGRGLRGSDKVKARKHASAICETERGIDYLIAAAESEAEHILIRNSFLVEALMEQVRVHRTMSGPEVEACIADAEAAKAAASWKLSGYLGSETVADIRARMLARQKMHGL